MSDVVLFHHAQGLTDGVRRFAGQLRAAGHRVSVPDLYEGKVFATLEEGAGYAGQTGFDTIIERGTAAAAAGPERAVYIGLSLGVLPAQKLAQTRPGAAGAVLIEACVPTSEFGGSWPGRTQVQVHGMDQDPFFAGEGDLDAARELMKQAPDGQLFLYQGDHHLFTDASLPGYDEDAAALVTQRVLAFLAALSRPEPAVTGAEQEMILQFLDFHRATMLAKTAGLDREQMARRVPSSTLTLAGLLYHLALVEENWSEMRFAGQPMQEPWTQVDWDADPEWEFRTAAGMDPDEVRQRYRDACERTRRVVARADSLDQLSVKEISEGRFSLRWMLMHLIEETARHVGHADFIREAIDGSTGE